MSIQKPVVALTGYFEEVFGNGKYSKFVSGGTKYFTSVPKDKQLPVGIEFRALFEAKTDTICEPDKNGVYQPNGILRLGDYLGRQDEQKK